MYLAASGSQGTNFLPLLLIAALFVLTYFMIIRPQSKRRREQAQKQATVGPGAEIVTVGGMFGTVIDADDESITLEIAPDVQARFVRAAIGQIRSNLADEQPAEADDELADDDASDELSESSAVQEEADTPSANEYAEVGIDDEPHTAADSTKSAKRG